VTHLFESSSPLLLAPLAGNLHEPSQSKLDFVGALLVQVAVFTAGDLGKLPQDFLSHRGVKTLLLEDVLLLVGSLETLLILGVGEVVRFQALKDQVQCVVKPPIVETPENHCLVRHCVWSDSLAAHLREQLLCLDDVASLDAGLNQTGVHNQAWLDGLAFHLFKNTKSVLQLVDLREDLDQDAVRHI